MPMEGNGPPQLTQRGRGGWWFQDWFPRRVVAAVTDRSITAAELVQSLDFRVRVVEADQVHGSSIAMMHGSGTIRKPVAGCDALVTAVPGVALLIRTADCVPIFISDPLRSIIGIAHAGWRGLAAWMPARLVAALRHNYQCQPRQLRAAIGPAIRSCCYEVGAEFAPRFGTFVKEQRGRRTCDLIGVAVDQLRRSGMVPERILDSHHCTACESQQWFSVRREGEATSRLTSIIVIRP